MRMANGSIRRVLIFAVAGTLIASATVLAQSRRQIVFNQVSDDVSEYWIGVLAVPMSEALSAQLGVEKGLLVERVVDESPAAEAGIERHDVILRFGESQVGQVQDLADAVEAAGESQHELELIRGGKRIEVEITPAQRPEQEVQLGVSPQDRERVRNWLREFEDMRNPLGLQLIRPGFTLPEGTAEGRLSLPDNMSIVIKKQGDDPASISVKKGDQSWEVTEDSLDELPEDVRSHVEKILGGATRLELGVEQWRRAFPNDADEVREQIEQWWKNVPRGPAPGVRRFRLGPERDRDELDETVEEMRIQIDRLRREVDSLRESKKDADRDA